MADKAIVKRKGRSVKFLCYTAALVALSAVANIFTLFLGAGNAFAVSFSYIPNFIAGAFLGPFSGIITGLFGDLIGCWIAPKGDINPIILCGSALTGLIPGLVFLVFRKLKKDDNWLLATIISFILVFVIASSINTLGLYVFYFSAKGRTLGYVFLLRTPKQFIVWAINLILGIILYLPLKKILKI